MKSFHRFREEVWRKWMSESSFNYIREREKKILDELNKKNPTREEKILS